MVCNLLPPYPTRYFQIIHVTCWLAFCRPFSPSFPSSEVFIQGLSHMWKNLQFRYVSFEEVRLFCFGMVCPSWLWLLCNRNLCCRGICGYWVAYCILVEVLHEATASESRRLKLCPFLDFSCHMSLLVREVVYLARWWQSVAFAISADAYGPADRKSSVCAWDLQVTVACAERNGWSWLHCTAHRALQNPCLWELLASSHRSHPNAVSYRNQISRQVNCLHQSEVLHWGWCDSPGPLAGECLWVWLWGLKQNEHLTVQFCFCLAFFTSFLAQNILSHCHLGQAKQRICPCCESRESFALLFYKTSCCDIPLASSHHSSVTVQAY